MSRNDDRMGEDACVAFAIYCDENGLTKEEGVELAERLADSLMAAAEGRDYA